MVDKIKPGFIRITVGKTEREEFRPFEEDDEVDILLKEKEKYQNVVGVKPSKLKIQRDFEPEDKK